MRPPTPDHTNYRDYLAATVARLADLLERWESWDIDQALPPMERRLTRPPLGDRGALTRLHRELLTELHDVDAAVQLARTQVPGINAPKRRSAAWPPV